MTIRTPSVRYRLNGAPADGPSPVDVCTLACAREWGSAGDEITILTDWRS